MVIYIVHGLNSYGQSEIFSAGYSMEEAVEVLTTLPHTWEVTKIEVAGLFPYDDVGKHFGWKTGWRAPT